MRPAPPPAPPPPRSAPASSFALLLRAGPFDGAPDEVLLVLPTSGPWALPGGRAEDEESPAGTLRREVAEEIGLAADGVDDLTLPLLSIQRPWRGPHDRAHLYLLPWDGTPPVPGGEIAETAWWPVDRLPRALTRTASALLAAGLPRARGRAPAPPAAAPGPAPSR